MYTCVSLCVSGCPCFFMAVCILIFIWASVQLCFSICILQFPEVSAFQCLCALVSVISIVYCGPVSACPWPPVSLWVSVSHSLCIPVLYILLVCFSVCISPFPRVPESLPVFCVFYVLVSVCPSSLCFSVCILVLEGTWVSAYPEPLQSSVCVFLSLCACRSLCLSVWESNNSLWLSVCTSLLLCIREFCVFLILYMSLTLCMIPSLYVSLSHCASLSLHVPKSLHVPES